MVLDGTAAPFELLTQDFRESGSGHHGQREGAGRETEDQPLGGCQFAGRSSINGNEDTLVSRRGDGDLVPIGNHQRPVAEDVGADGRDDQSAAIGHEDRSAGSQGVSGGTGGGRDNQAVGMVFGEGDIADPGPQPHKLGSLAPTDGHVVECTLQGNGKPVSADRGLQQAPVAELSLIHI